jgi:hypothetical protein
MALGVDGRTVSGMKRWLVVLAVGSLLTHTTATAMADPGDDTRTVNIPVWTVQQRSSCASGVEVRNDYTIYVVALGPGFQEVDLGAPTLGVWQTSRGLTRAESRALGCGLAEKLAQARREVRRLRAALATN